MTNHVINWADKFIEKLAYDPSAVDQEPDACLMISNFLMCESHIQAEYEKGNSFPHVLCNPLVRDVFLTKLDDLQVPRTHAAEMASVIGLNNVEEALMLAVLLKRISTLQEKWKDGLITAAHIDLFLNSGTVSTAAFCEMWISQKGFFTGLAHENLLEFVTVNDFKQ